MSTTMVSHLEVGICCRDLPALQRFYEEGLGCTAVSLIHVPAEKALPAAMSAQGYSVVRLQTTYGERIKLVQPDAAPLDAEADLPFLLDRAGSFYLTFIVADIDAAIQRLQQAGAQFLTGDHRVEVRDGVYLAFCKDPEGNVLELVTYADLHAYRNDLQNRN